MPSSPCVAPRCPQPHRAVLGSPAPTSRLGFEDPRGLCSPGNDHGDGRKIFATMGKVDHRPLSSVSTSAGPTPTPDAGHRSLPQSPIPAPAEPLVDGPARSLAFDGSQAQYNGKVFVGGIPQAMTAEQLTTVLSQIGTLKKVWLQRHRQGNGHQDARPTSKTKNHRGFGFAIFDNIAAVDRWLGDADSRFMELKGWDGKRLEVKRAVSSEDMSNAGDGAPRARAAAGDRLRGSGAARHVARADDCDTKERALGPPQMPKFTTHTTPAPQQTQPMQQLPLAEPHPQLMALSRWAADAMQGPSGTVPPPAGAALSDGVPGCGLSVTPPAHPFALLAQSQGLLGPMQDTREWTSQLEAMLRQAQPDVYED